MLKNPVAMLQLVERLGNLIRAEMRRVIGQEGLQPVHLEAMLFLNQANRFSNTPQSLAEFLGVTKGTVSQSLLLLDRRGLIERYQDEVDRRVVRLRLSQQGEDMLEEMQPASLWQSATRNISANRIRNGVAALRETLYMLQNHNGARTFGVCNTCIYCQRKSQRTHHCALFAERLSGPETRLVCREHVPKSAS
jgi:MarR family transcriptional regulator, negative regulator of the multidrug operon emrRAB